MRSSFWTVPTVVALLVAGTASGFELSRVNGDPCNRTDQNLFWQESQASYTARHLPPDFQDEAETAGVRWNETVALFRFALGNDSGFCEAEDGVISMGFLDTDCSNGAFGPNTLAVASTRFFLDGRIINGDIAFNTAFSSRFDDKELFLETSIHELGHTLGLAHSDQCGGSGVGTVMKAVVSNTQRFDRPQTDDINGANAIYGGGTVETPTPTPTRTPSPIDTGECVGDQDGDGAISSSEATRAVLAFIRRDVSLNPQADVDSDGAVSSSEATRSVLQFIRRRRCGTASTGPTPTPLPADGLASLLGVWQFETTIIDRFVDNDRFERVDSGSDGDVLVGTDLDQSDLIVVIEAPETGFDFFMLDRGTVICEYFAFGFTGPDAVAGQHYLTDLTNDGCGDLPDSPNQMAGFRASSAVARMAPASIASLLQREAVAAGQSRMVHEESGAAASTSGVDRGALEAAKRAVDGRAR